MNDAHIEKLVRERFPCEDDGCCEGDDHWTGCAALGQPAARALAADIVGSARVCDACSGSGLERRIIGPDNDHDWFDCPRCSGRGVVFDAT